MDSYLPSGQMTQIFRALAPSWCSCFSRLDGLYGMECAIRTLQSYTEGMSCPYHQSSGGRHIVFGCLPVTQIPETVFDAPNVSTVFKLRKFPNHVTNRAVISLALIQLGVRQTKVPSVTQLRSKQEHNQRLFGPEVECFVTSLPGQNALRLRYVYHVKCGNTKPYSKDTPRDPPYNFTLPSRMEYSHEAALIVSSQDQCTQDFAVLPRGLENLIFLFCGQ